MPGASIPTYPCADAFALEEAFRARLAAAALGRAAFTDPITVVAPTRRLLARLQEIAAQELGAAAGISFVAHRALAERVWRLAGEEPPALLPRAHFDALAAASLAEGRGDLARSLAGFDDSTDAVASTFRDLRDAGRGTGRFPIFRRGMRNCGKRTGASRRASRGSRKMGRPTTRGSSRGRRARGGRGEAARRDPPRGGLRPDGHRARLVVALAEHVPLEILALGIGEGPAFAFGRERIDGIGGAEAPASRGGKVGNGKVGIGKLVSGWLGNHAPSLFGEWVPPRRPRRRARSNGSRPPTRRPSSRRPRAARFVGITTACPRADRVPRPLPRALRADPRAGPRRAWAPILLECHTKSPAAPSAAGAPRSVGLRRWRLPARDAPARAAIAGPRARGAPRRTGAARDRPPRPGLAPLGRGRESWVHARPAPRHPRGTRARRAGDGRVRLAIEGAAALERIVAAIEEGARDLRAADRWDRAAEGPARSLADSWHRRRPSPTILRGPTLGAASKRPPPPS